MKLFEKESLFWFEMNDLFEGQMENQYLLNMNKEMILNLAPICLIGLHQFSLYTGESINSINEDEYDKYSSYILENYNEIYKMKYYRLKDKPKKLNLEKQDDYLKVKKILETIILPFYKINGMKSLNSWKEISRAYIANMLSIYEYDINHKSDDSKLKTSNVYLFLFTLNLINNLDIKGLYSRVVNIFDRKKILKFYDDGKNFKEKEIDYLESSVNLLENEEEWQLFLSNFANEKWISFNLEERFKTIFQLSKIVSIILKDKIDSISMLENGEEIKDILKNYLPLFLNQDQFDCENLNIPEEVSEKLSKTLTPYYNTHLNLRALLKYIESKKQNFENINIDLVKKMFHIAVSVISKVKSMIISQEYFPYAVDLQILQKRKIFVDILGIFSATDKEDKFKKSLNINAFDLEDYFINEEELNNMHSLKGVKKPLFHAYSGFLKIGKIISFLIGINSPTAKIFDYDLKKIIYYVIVLLGPHKQEYLVQTEELIEDISELFLNFCNWYDKQDNISKAKLFSVLELPNRLNKIKKS